MRSQARGRRMARCATRSMRGGVPMGPPPEAVVPYLGAIAELADRAGSYVPPRAVRYRGHALIVDAVLRHSDAGDVVLEGGVSSGYLAAPIVQAGRRVHGIELDPVAAGSAREVCERVIVGDLEDFDTAQLDDRYDLLLFGDTLEHLRDPDELLRRLRDRLVVDGTLVASIPNIANWSMRLALLTGRFRYRERGLLDRTHLRFYTQRTMIEMITDAGFDVIELTGAIPVPRVTWDPLCRVAHWLGNLRPSFFGYTIVIVARRADRAPVTR